MIEEKARELGRLLGQSSEYQELKRASDAVNQDADATALMRQMNELRDQAERMIKRGERPTPEMERQLQTLLEQVQQNANYQRVIVAQENAEKALGRVYEWIFEGIDKGMQSPIILV